MIVFGIDIPLVEVLLALAIIVFLLLAEAIIVLALLLRQMNKTKKLSELTYQLSESILEMKKRELEELDKLKK